MNENAKPFNNRVSVTKIKTIMCHLIEINACSINLERTYKTICMTYKILYL